jgi:hypothetical protein
MVLKGINTKRKNRAMRKVHRQYRQKERQRRW